MKTIPQKLIGALFIAAAALAAGQQQDAPQELRVRDIKAMQSKEVIEASPACQRAMKNPPFGITESLAVDPHTFFHGLDALMKESDEVVLAGITYRSIFALSPSGESAVTYFEVKVIRSWKGSHNVGDTLTFGEPVGVLRCGETATHHFVDFSTMIGTADWPFGHSSGPFVLFLHKAQGKDAQLVEGLLPAGGAGLQGMFSLQFDVKSTEERRCDGQFPGTLEWCDAFLDTSESPSSSLMPAIRLQSNTTACRSRNS